MILTAEQEEYMQNRVYILEEALWHLNQAAAQLKQPFATDETSVLEDLICSLSREQERLEERLAGYPEGEDAP